METITAIDFQKMLESTFTPSPSNWEDQVLYFLLVDRFSDGNEEGFAPGGQTPYAIWPAEFQHPETFTQKGKIRFWDHYPEYLEGDFESLKDIHLGTGALDDYKPSMALQNLVEVYKYWIAFADIDGYRVDTVKHMDPGAVRYFVSCIHEFAESIGKNNFYLIGEITGGRSNAFNTLEKTGLNAALGIDEVQTKMEYAVKGLCAPAEYFNLFRNSILVNKESHTWFKDKVVTMLDDHDKVVQGNNKARFCARDNGTAHIISALGLNVTSIGIPCIYYGSEQGFDGNGGNDRYIRESMFGGDFGAFRTHNYHFFNTSHPIFKAIAAVTNIRRKIIALRRGRQYLREISGDGISFGLPTFLGDSHQIKSIVAWSRILNTEEIIVAFNNDTEQAVSAWITIDNVLHKVNDEFHCIYSSHAPFISPNTTVSAKNGKSIYLTIPKATFVIYQKTH